MKITVAQLIENKEALRSFFNDQNMPFAVSYRLSDAVPQLDAEIRKIEQFNNELVVKYGEKQDDGTISIAPTSEKFKLFLEEKQALLKEEIEFRIPSVKVHELMSSNIKMSAVDLSMLRKIGLIVE